mmetsp:Transcript_27025/g.56857  ORF Transcript_27025/g.56857 Transcript_27025/m.56857 type:complete len:128 (-) Transcript_27025:41-424(-)|eukprot:CAMPEP_0171343770 /NCGR_PEP_ID=MMETSP0878-20121228/18012_1 /TAXON_ID=67004 /ORGANISM="Thalassiosira weissflogii, Strain CCMP1336" /LENGTH=127 /DNA_ID=CAMNT_0011846795 /DNA_START=742 /DNA_END=1125 /DNA_ORIENTATION=+
MMHVNINIPSKQRFSKTRVLPITLNEIEARNVSIDIISASVTSNEKITNKTSEIPNRYKGAIDEPSRPTPKLRNKVISNLKLKTSLFASKPKAGKQRLCEHLEEAQDHIGNMIKQLGQGMHWWGSFL